MNLQKLADQGHKILDKNKRTDIPLSDFLEVYDPAIKNIISAPDRIGVLTEELYDVMNFMFCVGIAQGYKACKSDQRKRERQGKAEQ